MANEANCENDESEPSSQRGRSNGCATAHLNAGPILYVASKLERTIEEQAEIDARVMYYQRQWATWGEIVFLKPGARLNHGKGI